MHLVHLNKHRTPRVQLGNVGVASLLLVPLQVGVSVVEGVNSGVGAVGVTAVAFFCSFAFVYHL